jgi:hypothetical protein
MQVSAATLLGLLTIFFSVFAYSGEAQFSLTVGEGSVYSKYLCQTIDKNPLKSQQPLICMSGDGLEAFSPKITQEHIEVNQYTFNVTPTSSSTPTVPVMKFDLSNGVRVEAYGIDVPSLLAHPDMLAVCDTMGLTRAKETPTNSGVSGATVCIKNLKATAQDKVCTENVRRDVEDHVKSVLSKLGIEVETKEVKAFDRFGEFYVKLATKEAQPRTLEYVVSANYIYDGDSNQPGYCAVRNPIY